MSRMLVFAIAVVLSTPGSPQEAEAAQTRCAMALEGAAFDREFVAQMIADNEKAAEELRTGPL